MSLSLVAAVAASETAQHSEPAVNPIWFGLGTLVVFLLLVWAVTRLNLDR